MKKKEWLHYETAHLGTNELFEPRRVREKPELDQVSSIKLTIPVCENGRASINDIFCKIIIVLMIMTVIIINIIVLQRSKLSHPFLVASQVLGRYRLVDSFDGVVEVVQSHWQL